MSLFGANLFAANTAATTTTAVATPQPAAEPEPIVMTAPAAEPQPAAPIETVPAAEEPNNLTTSQPNNLTAPTPKAQTKTEPTTKQEYIAPASPQEAHDRIETAATAVPAKITKQQQGDLYIFGGKTFSLRQAFTMLGGAFDKQSQSWSISVERYDNPALCQDTFDAEVERSKKAADATAKREADIQKRIDEAVAKARKEWEANLKTSKPNNLTTSNEGTISIADAQAATKKAMTLMLTMLSKTPEASIDAIIKKAYAS